MDLMAFRDAKHCPCVESDLMHFWPEDKGAEHKRGQVAEDVFEPMGIDCGEVEHVGVFMMNFVNSGVKKLRV